MDGWALEYSFDVDRKNQIIYEKIHGVWELETAERYHEDFKSEVAPLIKKPWAKLVDLANWKTSYPPMVQMIGKHLTWCRDNGMVLSLNVLNNPSTFRQLNEMFTIGGVKDLAHTFRTHDEAQRFLKENWLGRKTKA